MRLGGVRATALAFGVSLAASSCLVDIGDVDEGGAESDAGTGGSSAAGGGWPGGAGGAGSGGAGASGAGGASDGSAGSGGTSNLPSFGSYAYRRPISIAALSLGLPAGYSLDISIDHASLVSQGESTNTGSDVRIARWDGTSWNELDRVLDTASSWGSSATRIWFATEEPIAAATTDVSYYLFWGDPAAPAAPANADDVFLLADDFESGLSKWTPEAGFVLATDHSYSGSTSVKALPTSTTHHRLLAVGIDASDVVLESYWRLSASVTLDFAIGMRAQNPSAWDAYELSLEADSRMVLSKYVAGTFNAVYKQLTPLPPPANVWVRVEARVISSRMLARVDGVQVAPPADWTDMKGGSTNGTLWLRSYAIPSGQAWWVDDVRLRRFVDPEPVVSLGAVETR